MKLSDPFGLLDNIRDRFAANDWSFVNRTYLEARNSPEKIAMLGFQGFTQGAYWSSEHSLFLYRNVDDRYSLTKLEDFEELDVTVHCFSVFALGAFLGMYQSGDLDDEEFSFLSIHLHSYLLMNAVELKQKFNEAGGDDAKPSTN